ncbi:hypothetical protein A8924_3500 [Saccharopolyspora erythraea NRRL 2338]|uniref:Uncharacterized protein n=2 Tax=Saccharopolyspora erythraea TaxID=1836 RepID=A4FEB0_SACEN|nr:hypothetical protein [Saccharopolyspora erythraea]PFG96112.1 hypothetical protein A8924_3500 [Saccharopolyspora erythraea NRRL 2338]QRK92651.1 hypothetical protein JQX30_15945 [Saccharopolyspora erythraea]CAM02385.1 hypothetical protein SACE_3107 [Saccharopolyspora erythraea NRRL 2338]
MQNPVVALLLLGAGLCALGVVFYASLIALWLGSMAGVVGSFVIACTTLAGGGRWRPALVMPEHVEAGTAGLPRFRRNRPRGRDRAWPGYLASQWRYDLLAAWHRGRGIIVAGYRRIRGWGGYGEWAALRFLVQAVPFAGWSGVLVGTLAGGLLVTVVAAAVLVVAGIGWAAVIALLRGCDGMVRRIRRADAVCPHPECYYKQRLPDYRCPNCATVHRDIRPGLLGAVWRRCGCDTRLPTTVLRAARKLTALCERCGQPLHTGAAALTGISMPVFGAVSAGKTRLVHAGMVKLRDELAAAGAELEFDDEPSRQVFAEATRLVSGGGETAKTPAGRLPAAITARVRRGRRQALLSLFDAAGEFFVDRQENTELEFLDHARGLVFVVDPFSARWVRDQFGGAGDARVVAANPATRDPDDVYQVTVRRLKDYRVDLGRRALAVVVVKADLLQDLDWAGPLLSGRVREWLTTAGLENMVLSAERDFAEVRFFVASSLTGTRPGSALSPAEPFLWLMGRGGFPVSRGGSGRTVKEPV